MSYCINKLTLTKKLYGIFLNLLPSTTILKAVYALSMLESGWKHNTKCWWITTMSEAF